VPLTILSYEEQVNELKKAKRVIEGVAGRIESFRAPMLRINEDTVRALEETGFLSDTSIASQRFDGPLTFGSKRKLKWLIAPRKPYMISYDSIVKSGSSNILEIPISAAIFPFIGTAMRISPFITKILQKYLYRESKKTGKPIVFLFHPNVLRNLSSCCNKKRVMKLEVYDLKREEEKAWDSYVYNSNTSTFHHQLGWRNVVEKTYKHKPLYLIAKEEGEIKGVLPLFLIKSVLFGKKLVSVPFAPYGGVCAENEIIELKIIHILLRKIDGESEAVKLLENQRTD